MKDVASGWDVFIRGLQEGLKPDPLMTVSEWAEKNRILSSTASAEPGKWRNSRTPYLVEIMDCMSTSHPCQEIVFMAASQLGKTEALNNFLGYVIDYAPGPIMSVMPTLSMVKRNTKTRLDPLIESTPALASKVASPRSRDSGNTMFQKDFPGGTLVLVGANSPSELSSTPIKYLPMDEIDRYPGNVGDEGDAVSLATARTKTFRRRKIIKTSTPTIQGDSRIEAAYEDSDRRVYLVPCPHCGHEQELEFKNLRWEKGAPSTAQYVCSDCGSFIEEYHKTKMLADGRWEPQNPGHKIRGYRLSTLYSPLGFCSWEDIATQWEAIHKTSGTQRMELLKVFTNTMLGEPWYEKGDAPEWESLYETLREDYEMGTIPDGGVMLTAGVDVQKDRLECEIVAWGRNSESWSVDYHIFYGDPTQGEVWENIDRLLKKDFPRSNGTTARIRMMAVDAGYHTQHVYNFVRGYASDHVVAVMGRESLQNIANLPTVVDIKINGKRISRGSRVWPIGVSVIKREVYANLKQRPPIEGEENPSGLCHFPQYPPEFFKQLTAEQVVMKRVRGFSRYMWEKTRERNEALDCRVYARAAAHIAGLDRFEEKHFATLENSATVRKVEGTPAPRRKKVRSMI